MSTLLKRNTKGRRINDEDEDEYAPPIDTADQEKIVSEFEAKDTKTSAITLHALVALNVCLGVLKLYYCATAYPFAPEPNCASHPHLWGDSAWNGAVVRWLPCLAELVSAAGFFGCAYFIHSGLYAQVVKCCCVSGAVVMGVLLGLSSLFGDGKDFHVSVPTVVWLTGVNVFVSMLVHYALEIIEDTKDGVSDLRKKIYEYKSV